MPDESPAVRPSGALRWTAALIGASPHLGVLVYSARPLDFGFMGGTDQLALVPFAAYGTPELYIVPAMLLVALGLRCMTRTRFLATWMLFGTLAGATAVLLMLVAVADTQIAIAAPEEEPGVSFAAA